MLSKYLKTKKKRQQGALFIEVMIALTIVGIMGTTIVGFFPRLLADTTTVKHQAELVSHARYVAAYLVRWSNFSQTSKLAEGQVIDEYEDGDDFDLFNENRVNRLYYADSLVDAGESVPDEYKVTMTFRETDRVESAVVQIVVWYDDNNDNVLNNGESNVPLSLVVSEKKSL